MSIGNLKDQGNKGNNFPYQLKNLQLLGQIVNTPRLSNLKENAVTASNATALEDAINLYFDAAPDLILVSKSVVYDTTASKFVAFLTTAKI